MSISDRLDEIEARRAQANSSLNGRHMLVGKDVPEMLDALRAVLDLHPAVDPDVSVDHYREPDYCPNCREYYPCPTVRAITIALGEES